jgi:hypothetical protein
MKRFLSVLFAFAAVIVMLTGFVNVFTGALPYFSDDFLITSFVFIGLAKVFE